MGLSEPMFQGLVQKVQRPNRVDTGNEAQSLRLIAVLEWTCVVRIAFDDIAAGILVPRGVGHTQIAIAFVRFVMVVYPRQADVTGQSHREAIKTLEALIAAGCHDFDACSVPF